MIYNSAEMVKEDGITMGSRKVRVAQIGRKDGYGNLKMG